MYHCYSGERTTALLGTRADRRDPPPPHELQDIIEAQTCTCHVMGVVLAWLTLTDGGVTIEALNSPAYRTVASTIRQIFGRHHECVCLMPPPVRGTTT